MREDLQNLYQRIEYLRNQGIKMKEIADHIGMTPSVLSALYSTVLPAYFESLRTCNEEQALNDALALVNNISKKRLLTNLQDTLSLLQTYTISSPDTLAPLTQALVEGLRTSASEISNYQGTYISYSLSSSSDALKIEPFLFTTSEDGQAIRIGRISAYRTIQWGCGIINNHQNLYITFSETTPPQLNLVTLYLQLPFREHPRLLRGLYLALDYNRNPIARRIILIKQSDNSSVNDFIHIKSGIIPRTQLTPEQEVYYRYTCQSGDYIKMCTVPSPHLDESDLEKEKRMLEL